LSSKSKKKYNEI